VSTEVALVAWLQRRADSTAVAAAAAGAVVAEAAAPAAAPAAGEETAGAEEALAGTTARGATAAGTTAAEGAVRSAAPPAAGVDPAGCAGSAVAEVWVAAAVSELGEGRSWVGGILREDPFHDGSPCDARAVWHPAPGHPANGTGVAGATALSRPLPGRTVSARAGCHPPGGRIEPHLPSRTQEGDHAHGRTGSR
jgi:hypothetical protein